MKIELTFLKSKVARRISILFILSALIPILALSSISFHQVTEHLVNQSKKHIHRSGKTFSLSIYERLLYIENDLILFGPAFDARHDASIFRLSKDHHKRLKAHFKALAVIDQSGACLPFLGEIRDPASFTKDEQEYLDSGRSIISTQYDSNNQLHTFIMKSIDPGAPRKGILYGEINTIYLWGLGEYDTLPSMIELSIFDASHNLLFSSHPISPLFCEKLGLEMARFFSGWFEWEYEKKAYVANFRSLFLQQHFFTPKWTIVVSSSKDDIYAPLAYFKKIFPFVILLSILVVLLLSTIQIRRITLPLEKLKEGTKRIAMRDFKCNVVVKSGDEFEELGASFNHMAKKLAQQFSALTTMAEIDRSILSILDTDKIVDSAIHHMKKLFNADLMGVFLFDFQFEGRYLARAYIETADPYTDRIIEDIEVDPEDAQNLHDHPEISVIENGEKIPQYLLHFEKSKVQSLVILPIYIQKRLHGVIAMGSVDSEVFDQEELLQSRQLANQVAVALSNARLIEELDQLNWGTLTALARTVDAKSPWTAGHSERVTKMALKIGRIMGLSPSDLDELHRAGLLHDIGKLGISGRILDKPDKLSLEEFTTIKQHPLIGARILEPISAYKTIIPLIEQHHERFDGKGYPYGLSGEDICLGARILAVADVYDALITDRPYRAGMGKNMTLEIIKEGSGTQFDPEAVKALLMLLDQEKNKLKTDKKRNPLHDLTMRKGAEITL
ncbi:MAG: HD domain-containing phosphohydrolase [bacterium]